MTKQITIPLALMERLVEALDKLARLGNEPHFGNSDGNVIAQEALTAGRAALDGAGQVNPQQAQPIVTREMLTAAHGVTLEGGQVVLGADLLERIYLAMRRAEK